MLDHITRSSNSVYARAVSPSQEGLLRTEPQHDISQKPQSAAKHEQAEHVREQKIVDKREEQRQVTSYRSNNEIAKHSPKHSSSQASELADKLLEEVRQSRLQRVKAERQKAVGENNGQQRQVDRAYQAANTAHQPRFVDEIV